LEELNPKLNKRKLKTKDQIAKGVETILKKYKVERFFKIEINEKEIRDKVKIGKGRPGHNSKYKTVITQEYSITWSQDKTVLTEEKNVDGIFPGIVYR